MSATTQAARATVLRFLEALAGDAGAGEFVELRYRLEDGERMGQVFEPARRLGGLATRALSLARRTDVYVGCAPRARRYGGRDAVKRGFVLWADCDGEAAVGALETFDPAPSIVIASGTGGNLHAYWPLAESLARDQLERGNRRIAHALGADPAAADAARILRPPETRSHKHSPRTPVAALRLEPGRRFSAASVVGGLADPPLPERSEPTAPADARPGGDPLLAIPPAVYVTRLLGVAVPRHRKVPCPFHADERPSLHVYETPERGWYCFGRCRRGGSIYDLAAPLFGYETRGEGFLRLKAELRSLFTVEEA